MTTIVHGVEIIRGLTDQLNHICETESGIETDDARIWDQWLHQLTTEEWAAVVAALESLEAVSPGSFLPRDVTVLQQAQADLAQAQATGKSFVGRPMIARSGYKRTAWQLTMTMREVVNRYNGDHIPNRPK